MNIKVTRSLFFDNSYSATLCYLETSPPEEQCEHQVCNCTKTVVEKPVGKPSQRKQCVELLSSDKYYNFEVWLSGESCHFTLRWPGITWDKDHKWSSKNHAYYWFDVNGVKNNLNVEITKEAYGNTNCFFGHIYLGNDIDISRFFNGHSPSRVVDLTKIRSNELWAHECGFGGVERICRFNECDETQEWRTVYDTQKRILRTARTYAEDFVSDVNKVRSGVEQEIHLIDDVQYLCRWFSWVTRNLDQTEMFRCADYCYKTAMSNL